MPITFGNIAKKETKPKSGKEYPVFPCTDEHKAKVDWLYEKMPYEKQIKSEKSLWGELITPFWLRYASGKAGGDTLPGGVRVPGTEGKELLVSCTAKLTGTPTEEQLKPVLGSRVRDFFEGGFVMEIDSTKIPQDRQQEVVDKVGALFAEMGLVDALSAKETFKPRPEFFLRRHQDFTPDQNMAINAITRIITTVKARM